MIPDGEVLNLKYPWQRFLLEAFVEFDPDPQKLRARINTAQRIISARLSDLSPDVHERIELERCVAKSAHIVSRGACGKRE